MRWDRLFDDLASQLEQGLDAEETDLRAEEERLRIGRMPLRSRLSACARAGQIRVELRNAEVLAMTVTTVGRDWFSATQSGAADLRMTCLVPIGAVASVVLEQAQLPGSIPGAGSRDADDHDAAALSTRLGFAVVLRDLCRRRATVQLRTMTGALHGTIDRVGRDHLDLAEHDPSVPRRGREVQRFRVVHLDQLLVVRV